MCVINIVDALCGPLSAELGSRVFSHPPRPPQQLDLAAFTIQSEWASPNTDKSTTNTCVDFAPARLIDGTKPRPCTLLDPIEADLGQFDSDEQEKLAHTWVTQLCLDNGYEGFEQELCLTYSAADKLVGLPPAGTIR
jgi:hypothetical protein